jgi:hypothetical protein
VKFSQVFTPNLITWTFSLAFDLPTYDLLVDFIPIAHALSSFDPGRPEEGRFTRFFGSRCLPILRWCYRLPDTASIPKGRKNLPVRQEQPRAVRVVASSQAA